MTRARGAWPNATTPELRRSYRLCERVAQFHPAMWTASEALPDTVRPYLRALNAFAVWTDRLADDHPSADRRQRLTRWCAETLADVRAGRTEHPLRRALVHTMRTWDLDIELLRELLETTLADNAVPPRFATFADQRRYLRGVAGTVTELWTPLLDPHDTRAASLMSLLGEACQLADILQDFPVDLADGRCYLPGDDLARLGLEAQDFYRGEGSEVLGELVESQVGRTWELLRQAAPVAGMVRIDCQPFLHTILLGVEFVLEEAGNLGAQVLAEGIDTAVATGARLPRDPEPVVAAPAHVAVILDGNRRWAADHGLPAAEGHSAGLRAVLRLLHSALRLRIAEVSVFAFSTENWNRSPEDVAALFEMMAEGVARGMGWLHGHGVRVCWHGRRDRLERSLASALAVMESMTSNNRGLVFNVFADYGGHDEIVGAARALAAEAVAGRILPQDITMHAVAGRLAAPELPAVDLLIRTSGEQRLSNFLPWHAAYAEFVFDPVPWPEFAYAHLRSAITEYAGRQRRFGSDVQDPVQGIGAAAGGV
ncbi:polyprenyl diphosphate synthase [Amycolatopsis magusensis]|uniref:polyprenyl diphosphate synthase n=1 Tax=Amycolatopsis magusensis TaxID=882444 RepID=UPI0024A8DEC3|nr:polyprenyl diphosphate synthase [Amycolatopsis magusensis]MDI5976089.1 polyprenyl diphosphate synthase [Amycolatopsis magusensis]